MLSCSSAAKGAAARGGVAATRGARAAGRVRRTRRRDGDARLHIGVGAGALCVFLVGGARDQQEVVAAGQPSAAAPPRGRRAGRWCVESSRSCCATTPSASGCATGLCGRRRRHRRRAAAADAALRQHEPQLQLFLPGAVRSSSSAAFLGLRYLSRWRVRPSSSVRLPARQSGEGRRRCPGGDACSGTRPHPPSLHTPRPP